MRITVVALGTRGDVQPMLALARGLQIAGHEVCLIAGSNFAAWVQAQGMDFAPSIDIEALMKSPKGVEWVERSDNPRKQLSLMRELLLPHSDDMARPIVDRASTTDVFVSGFVSEPFVQSVCEKYGVRQINAPLQPYRPTREGAAAMAAVLPRQRSIFNYWAGQVGEYLIWSVARDSVNRLRQTLDLPAHTVSTYTRVAHTVPTVYGFSRHVVPFAPEWGANTHISGYWFLDEDPDWQPSADLTHFLANGTSPVYVGFGSMSSSDPQATVDLVVEALRRTNQRGILIRGWSGAESVALPDHVLMLDRVPHGWLFERVAAVVHHGDAGTTAAGLRAGKPALIIPHMSDQPFWGRRVYDLGVGAKPIPRHKLTVDNLAQSIRTVTSDANIQRAASALGEKIRAEDGVLTAVSSIDKILTQGK